MPRVVAFVPIKLNSERLPNKNIKPFTNGKPLVSYILTTLTKVHNIDEIYVYCSDEKIQNYIPDPSIKFLKRSKHLDTSTVSFNEVLKCFAEEIDSDYYVLSHATAPFIQSKSIETGVDKVLNEDYDSAIGVQKIQEFLWKDGKPLNYDLDNIPRTQDLPDIYAETCGLYIYSRELILKENRRIGNKPYFVELSKIESIDIDEKEDFEIADAIFQYIKLWKEFWYE